MIEISREVQVVVEEALVAERGREYVFKASAGGRQAVLPRLTIRELAKGRDVVLFSQQSEAMEYEEGEEGEEGSSTRTEGRKINPYLESPPSKAGYQGKGTHWSDGRFSLGSDHVSRPSKDKKIKEVAESF